MLLKGDCREQLLKLADNSVDSVVTDPPYELGFMGKAWDASGIAYNAEVWRECLRVLKPGGHLLAFGGSRTYHRLACAVEDAGFEIRDQIMWIYGSGFPKSLDVSKAIDKSLGAEREVIARGVSGATAIWNETGGESGHDITAPATPEARQWEGWGTALKPAHEPIVVARKPLEGTVASNVLEWGTGALNIDACRIPHVSDKDLATSQAKNPGREDTVSSGVYGADRPQQSVNEDGRWPANVILDGSDEVVLGFPMTEGGARPARANVTTGYDGGWGLIAEGDRINYGGGSASRFFYCAKAATSERDEGLDELTPSARQTMGSGIGGQPDQTIESFRNVHPTVKPLELMRYLIKLVTPKSGLVLDPFLGSGTTACAAILEGCDWVGCELTPDYWPIIEGRIQWADNEPKPLFYL
jgi:DNA methylase